MKHHNNNKIETTNLKRKKSHTDRETEANARRKINRTWMHVEETSRYRRASSNRLYQSTTSKINDEVLDPVNLNLNLKSRVKSANAQYRLLRRIVEKRQAQANHKKNGRSEDLTSLHYTILCVSRCMVEICSYGQKTSHGYDLN